MKLLDVVALLEDVPAEGLRRGEVGTVVEVFSEQSDLPKAYLVEFSGDDGVAYAFAALRPDQLMRLYFRRDEAA
ncbi:MAG: DUF4926 domain-containing protein [Acidobacteriota bacterium]|nr:DUF4926 domain-containing protein [Acidobacteriota bacterium]